MPWVIKLRVRSMRTGPTVPRKYTVCVSFIKVKIFKININYNF